MTDPPSLGRISVVVVKEGGLRAREQMGCNVCSAKPEKARSPLKARVGQGD